MFEREEICMLEGDAQADDTRIRSAHTPHGNILPLGGAGCSTIAAGAGQDPARAARVHFLLVFRSGHAHAETAKSACAMAPIVCLRNISIS